MISYYPYQNLINKRHIGKNNCPLTRLSVISEIVNFCKYISHLLNFDTANMVVFDTKYSTFLLVWEIGLPRMLPRGWV